MSRVECVGQEAARKNLLDDPYFKEIFERVNATTDVILRDVFRDKPGELQVRLKEVRAYKAKVLALVA